MTFQALLVSKDEEAVAVLTTVLSEFGVTANACGYPEGICQLTEQKFDTVLVDFDDPHSAELLLQNVFQSPSSKHVVTVALLCDKAKVRNVFGKGANFVLYKPLSTEQAEAGLRAATALIKRERRSSYRVAVQVPVQLKLQEGPEFEGILLDLSEDGMDLLAAQPLCVSAPIKIRFCLPNSNSEIQVQGEIAWANPNGQAGVQFDQTLGAHRDTIKAWVAANATELPPLDPEPVTQCKLTDLSLGGCYVQTESPFPERSGIALTLRAEGVEVQVEGRVRVMHPGFGMGIEFPSHTAEERAEVTRFIGFLTSRPGTTPELTITPRALTAASHDDSSGSSGDHLDDPLLELLRRHESLNQDEFVTELEKQRGSAASA